MLIDNGEDIIIYTIDNDDIRTIILDENNNSVYKYIVPNKAV